MQEQSTAYLTTSGVARRLIKSPDRVRQLTREGSLIPAIITESGQRLYTVREVERYLAAKHRSAEVRR